MARVIGLCGREGAGKSAAAANLVIKLPVIIKEYNDPWKYIQTCLECDNNFLALIKKRILATFPNISQKFNAPIPNQIAPEISFADPLKMICVPITGVNYNILCGLTQETRIAREQILSISFSARQVLQIIGTMFRDIDPDFWVNLAVKRAKAIIDCVPLIIFSDVRFKNEANAILNMGGEILFICRKLSDLQITENDNQSHESTWKFLEMLNSNSKIIVNNGSVSDMCMKILQNSYTSFR